MAIPFWVVQSISELVVKVNHLTIPGCSQIQALIAISSSWSRGAEAVLTKPALGSPAQPHRGVYPCARAEWAALVTSPVPQLPEGLAGTLCCAHHVYSAPAQPGQEELTSASNAPCRYCQQSCPRPPRKLWLWPGTCFHSCPIQLTRKNVTAVWKLLHLSFLDKLLANRLFCAFGESHISAELVNWLLSLL